MLLVRRIPGGDLVFFAIGFNGLYVSDIVHNSSLHHVLVVHFVSVCSLVVLRIFARST